VTNFHAVMIVSSLSAVELLKTRSFAAGLHAQHSAQCSAGDGPIIALYLCLQPIKHLSHASPHLSCAMLDKLTLHRARVLDISNTCD